MLLDVFSAPGPADAAAWSVWRRAGRALSLTMVPGLVLIGFSGGAGAQPAAEVAVSRSLVGLHELSPWSMFLAADVVVKAVMIGLAFASLVTWTIFVGKTIELAAARQRLAKAITRIGDARLVAEAQLALPKHGFVRDLLRAARDELEMSGPRASRDGVKERTESRLADLVRNETQSMRRGMGLLATIGSTAPFVGLFGTVWGIMNSFIGISKSQTTNLAVVAPGIAEALLATAIGLVAAIPAVIIYNHFSRATRSYQLLIARATSVVTRLVSREFDCETHAARAADEVRNIRASGGMTSETLARAAE